MKQVAIFKSFTNNERFWDQYSQRLTVTQKQEIAILIHVKRVLKLSSFLYQNQCFILSDFSNYFYLFIYLFVKGWRNHWKIRHALLWLKDFKFQCMGVTLTGTVNGTGWLIRMWIKYYRIKWTTLCFDTQNIQY